jgi:hypothetical protein
VALKLVSERRAADRRQSPVVPGRSNLDRRQGDRRRRIARAGVLAAVALVSSRAHRVDYPLGAHTLPSPMLPVPDGLGEVGPFEVPAEDPNDRAVIDAIIDEAAAVHGVSADLVRAVVQTESQFDPRAVSPVGAKGLMQLMPGTAREVGIKDPFDVRQNIFGGTKYLGLMLERFNGNVALALAGYNAGPNNVKRYRGIPPFGETQGYVRKIRNILHEAHGAAFPIPETPRRTARARRATPAARAASARRPVRVSQKVNVRKATARKATVRKATTSRSRTASKVASGRTTVASSKARSASRATKVVRASRTPAKKPVARRTSSRARR